MNTRSPLLVVRTITVLGVLVAMPVLAIPRVNQALNSRIHQQSHALPERAERWEEVAYRAAGADIPAAVRRVGPNDETVQARLLSARHKLEQLGAEYMLLEWAPREGPFYRFQCRMRVPGTTAEYTRLFEAHDRNPDQAMQRVLDKVRSWRSQMLASRIRDPLDQ